MFVCRRNYKFFLSVFEFPFKKLHNLKTVHGFCIILIRKLDVFLSKNKMLNSKENNIFLEIENEASSNTDRNAGPGGHPNVPCIQKGSYKWTTSNKESIDVNKNTRKLNPYNRIEYTNKRECLDNFETFNYEILYHNHFIPKSYCPSSSCLYNMPTFSNFHQDIVWSNFGRDANFVPLTPPVYSFREDVTFPPTPHDNLHYMCFNSNKHGTANGKKVLKTTASSSQRSVTRSWELTRLGRVLERINGGKNPGITFKIMSYNVLAQDLLDDHPELYSENNEEALKWDYRWKKLLSEITQYNCEIICLQEVQYDHIEKYFSVLKSLGYNGLYKQRTGGRTDGCAIYYNKSIFNLVEHTTVEYRQTNIPLLNRDNVAIVAKFAPKNNLSAEFVVATTHLLYNPRRQDVRVAQIQLLLTEIDRIAYRGCLNGCNQYVPVIITGDLNSTPTSAVYKLLTKGILKYENLNLRKKVIGKELIPPSLSITDNCQHAALLSFRQTNVKITRNDEQKLISLENSDRTKLMQEVHGNYKDEKFSTGTLSHNFAFKSVYNHTIQNDKEGTAYQNEWVTVDYIFYSGIMDDNHTVVDHKLKLLSRYTLPTTRQLVNTRIPNFQLGSDHLAVLAKFKFEYN